MNKINIGIIGPGKIANKFAKACQFVGSANILAVASSQLQRAQEFAEKYEIPYAYEGYEKLLNNDKIDAVYISVINSLHLDVIKAAIKANKAILCEKPCVVNKEQCDELTSLLKKSDVLFMEAMWTLHLPTIIKAKSWLDGGRIGQLKSIEATLSFYAGLPHTGRLFEKELYGGGLLDVGVYCIQLCNYIAGDSPVDVKSFEHIGHTKVDEYGSALLKYKNDVIAECNYGVSLNRQNNAYIFGEDGYICLEKFMGCRNIYLYNNKDELLDSYSVDFENGFKYEIEHFCNLIYDKKKESPVNTHANTINFINVLEKIKAQRDL